MNERTLLLFALTAVACTVEAQDLAPFTTYLDRFVVFDAGRFEDLESRKPREFSVSGGRLAYVTDGGDLKLYEDGKVYPMERGTPVKMHGSGYTIAYTTGGVLKVAEAGEPRTLCYDAPAFEVKDSLVVFHDRREQSLSVHWRHRTFPIANVIMGDGSPDWAAGANMVTFFDRASRTAYLFYRGETTVFAESTNSVQVAVGSDILGWSEDRDRSLRVMDHGETFDLEPFPPVNMKAGSGILAYTTVGQALKCYQGGQVYTVTEFPPTSYHVQDSLLVFVDQGMLKVFQDGRVEIVERFVPEQWAIWGGMLVYLDLNRRIRLYHHGTRKQLSPEAGVARFDLYRGAVTYRSNSGATKVWWQGKIYEHY